jgi:hypothetical protein
MRCAMVWRVSSSFRLALSSLIQVSKAWGRAGGREGRTAAVVM